jgi:drug/metabolite transporter (DMT)-like permease
MDPRALLMGLAFAAMWSSAFASARVIVAHAPPLGALALRFWISGGLALALAWALGQGVRLPRSAWRPVAVFGLCQNALYLGLNFVAMQEVEASLAAILASTMPLLVAALGWLVGRRVGGLGAAGLATGFAGVAVVMAARLGGGADPSGVALCVVGALSLAVATLTLRDASAGGGVLTVVGWQMLVGAAALTLAAAFETPEVRWSPALGLAFAYTVLVPGLLATLTWFVLVRRIGAVRASAFHFLNPPLGVAFAAVLLGEAVGPWDLVGVAVTAAGILMVQLAREG